jgi:hypothetical protein
MINKKDFDKAKNQYNSVEIPEELEGMVEQTIHDMEDKRGKINTRRSTIKYSIVSAAACMVVLVTALNTNEAFAKNMEGLPVIGGIAKVLTIRSYEEKDIDKNIVVNVPAIESQEEISQKVNQVISEKVDNYVKEANERVLEYKEAFISTGGTEEEFSQHDIKINVDYEVKYQDENRVSFVLTGSESWVSAYNIKEYYNISLIENKELTLRDILGNDYVQIANDRIIEEMALRMEANKDLIYFDESQGGFSSVDDTTKFYINDKENVVIVFDKYEIAPGYMGSQEFIVTR